MSLCLCVSVWYKEYGDPETSTTREKNLTGRMIKGSGYEILGISEKLFGVTW